MPSKAEVTTYNRTECGGLLVSCKFIPARYVLAFMSLFGMFTVYSLRVNMSIAIVAMVDYEAVDRQLNVINQKEEVVSSNVTQAYRQPKCENWVKANQNKTSTNLGKGQKFLWDENMQGLVLASYFYGYASSQVLGPLFGRKVGYVRVWGYSMLSASILTLFLPVLSRAGAGAIVATRILVGILSGVSYPTMHGIWGSWAPPTERSKLLCTQFAGSTIGLFVVLPLSGFLSNEVDWESVFYVTGAGGVVWAILWILLIYDTPSKHPRISQKEREYIETSLMLKDMKSVKSIAIPWISIFTSRAFWAVLVIHFSNIFGVFMFITLLPTYLSTMMDMNVKASGFLSALPFIFKLVAYFAAGVIADWMITRGYKVIHVRKLFSLLAQFIPGAALIVSGYVRCNVALVMVLFTLPIALESFSSSGHKVSILEMAPAFSGIVFGICNTLGACAGFIAPQIAGLFREANRENPIMGWRSLFWLGGIMYFIGGSVFLLFGSSDVQEWAKPDKKEDENALTHSQSEMQAGGGSTRV